MKQKQQKKQQVKLVVVRPKNTTAMTTFRDRGLKAATQLQKPPSARTLVAFSQFFKPMTPKPLPKPKAKSASAGKKSTT